MPGWGDEPDLPVDLQPRLLEHDGKDRRRVAFGDPVVEDGEATVVGELAEHPGRETGGCVGAEPQRSPLMHDDTLCYVLTVEVLINSQPGPQLKGVRESVGCVDLAGGEIDELCDKLRQFLRETYLAAQQKRLQRADEVQLTLWGAHGLDRQEHAPPGHLAPQRLPDELPQPPPSHPPPHGPL